MPGSWVAAVAKLAPTGSGRLPWVRDAHRQVVSGEQVGAGSAVACALAAGTVGKHRGAPWR